MQEVATFILPHGFKLDRTYHQSAWVCCGGGATSAVTVADVPNGIYIRIDGGYYWAIAGKPRLIAADFDENNVVTQFGNWKFRCIAAPEGTERAAI